jgi:SagB-type dehydrogenase family enzyme
MNLEGLANGVYHYSVRRNGLELLSEEDPRPWIGHASGGQDWVADSAAVFLTTSVLYRMAWKYQSSRALRVVLHDIGHLSQTFSLVATWLGLGAFTTGALRDEVFEKKLGLDYLEEPVLLLTGAGHVRNPGGDNARPVPASFKRSGRTLTQSRDVRQRAHLGFGESGALRKVCATSLDAAPAAS